MKLVVVLFIAIMTVSCATSNRPVNPQAAATAHRKFASDSCESLQQSVCSSGPSYLGTCEVLAYEDYARKQKVYTCVTRERSCQYEDGRYGSVVTEYYEESSQECQ